jgi:hypothetical protein
MSELQPFVLELPPEIIIHILSYVSPLALELLARTYVKQITYICLDMPALRYRIDQSKNARRMMQAFEGFPAPYPSWTSQTAWEDFSLQKVFGSHSIHAISHPFAHLEYLNMRGDLAWLKGFDEVEVSDVGVCLEGNMDTLETATRKLGLVLPATFVQLMKSKDVLRRIRGNIYLNGIFKVGSRNGSHFPDGYIVEFMHDTTSTFFFLLYLDTQGGHCVLQSEYGMDGHRDETSSLLTSLDKQLGVFLISADDEYASEIFLEMQGTCFESWLAVYCIGEIIFLISKADKGWEKLPDIVLYYLSSFTEEGAETAKRGLLPPIPERGRPIGATCHNDLVERTYVSQ